jgi:hypothetical protein
MQERKDLRLSLSTTEAYENMKFFLKLVFCSSKYVSSPHPPITFEVKREIVDNGTVHRKGNKHVGFCFYNAWDALCVF